MRRALPSLVVSIVACCACNAVLGMETLPGPAGNNDSSVDDTATVDGTPFDTVADSTAEIVPDDDTGAPDSALTAGERNITLVFASPDLGARYACLGIFTSDPMTTDPYAAIGPFGAPTASGKPEDFLPASYGAVIPIPLNDSSRLGLEHLDSVLFLTGSNPLTAMPPTTCAALWKTVRTDASAYKLLPARMVKEGEHVLIAMTGCKGSGLGQCGSGANFEIRVDKPSTLMPATFSGASSGPKVGVQFFSYSRYALSAGYAPPSFQNVDVYIQLRKSDFDGGTPVPDGAPVKIATNVKYGDHGSVVGVQAGDASDLSLLAVVPTGHAPGASCETAPSMTCTTYIALKAFLTEYKPSGGGFIDGQNQFFALTGAPLASSVTDAGTPDPASVTTRVQIGRAYDPTK